MTTRTVGPFTWVQEQRPKHSLQDCVKLIPTLKLIRAGEFGWSLELKS